MQNQIKNYYVLTGGPGTGKTTLLNHLSEYGFHCIPEVARQIIKDQVLNRGSALPWANKAEYARLMWEESLKEYERSILNENRFVFFDRGLLDSICYMEMENLPMTIAQFEILKKPLYHKIFILPPWEEIYVTDSERKQTWEEAQYTFDYMRKLYLKYGYEVIEIPKMDIELRVKFILENL